MVKGRHFEYLIIKKMENNI